MKETELQKAQREVRELEAARQAALERARQFETKLYAEQHAHGVTKQNLENADKERSQLIRVVATLCSPSPFGFYPR